jgi:hypothetical protein
MESIGFYNFDFSIIVNNDNQIEILQQREDELYSIYLDKTQITHLINGLRVARKISFGNK